MTDDSTMDKKNHGILASKCLAGPVVQDNSRPRQDGSGGNQTNKNFSRTTPRRRQSPSTNPNAVKTRSEAPPLRKPTPQKSKAMDKKLRFRDGHNKQSEDRGVLKKGPELGSLQTPGSKKQSLNHLLNFHFAPRENHSLSAGSWRSYNTHPGGGWRARNGSGSAMRPKFNKENFLQANCQFLVKASGDYSAHKYNPDVLVDWDMIEQIYIRVAGEFPNCPICLSPPVAAKMTKCGHIFCWPCLLHYLALSDKKYRKCPICFELVYKNELKSVVATHYDDVQVGEELEMQLMFRKKGLFQAMPLMCKDGGATFNWESIFSKLLPVTPEEVKVLVLERETCELQDRLEEEKHCPEVCFVEQAINELQARLINLSEHKLEESKDLGAVLGALNLSGAESMSTDSSPSSEETASFQLLDDSDVVSKKMNDSVDNESGTSIGSDEETSASKSDDCFYFYQAMKGENIFLHPINMAMLWKSFGNDPTTWPQVIQFRVIEKESIIMTDEMRKRMKFLQHMPLTTNLQLIEVELRPPVISEEILNEFGQQLETRRKRRIQRAREERRRERKLEEEERRRDHLHQCPRFEFRHDFPKYSYSCTEPSENVNETDSLHEDSATHVSTTDDENPNHVFDSNYNLEIQTSQYSCSPPGMSFAQIVSQKSVSQTSVKYGVVLSGTNKTADYKPSGASKDNGDEVESGEYTSVPAYRMSMSDAIARAIANVDVVEDLDTSQANTNGKKKGRKKGKVLFATGMGCYN